MERKLNDCAAAGDTATLHSINCEALQQTTPHENTALHIAAKCGHAGFVRALVEAAPDLLRERNYKGDTAIHEAARRGYPDVVRALLGVDKQTEKDPEESQEIEEIIRLKNAEDNTALHEAAKGGHGDVVSVLLKIDEDLACYLNAAGESPLFKACEEGHCHVARQLLKSSPSIQYDRAHDRRTILHAALLGGHSDVAHYLLKEQPDLATRSDKFGRTPLHTLTCREDELLEMVEELLMVDSSACYKFDGNGRTPLHIAVENGHSHIVKEILSCRPDCIELSEQKRKRNILHLAVEHDHYKVVRYLFRKKKIEISEMMNEGDSEGNTPLHLATMKDSLEMVKLLLSQSRARYKPSLPLNIKAVNNAGHTALDITQIKGGHSFVQICIWKALREAGCVHGEHYKESNNNNKDNDPLVAKFGAAAANSADKSLKRMAETLSVVAALIATVTFAAAFTLPGGLHQVSGEEGTAVMINHTVFKVFVVSDTVAMCSSMIVALILVWAVPAVPGLLAGAVGWGLRFLWVALGGMVVTFVTALYLVVAPKSLWLAVFVCVVGCSTPFIVSPLVIDSAKRNVHKAGFQYG